MSKKENKSIKKPLTFGIFVVWSLIMIAQNRFLTSFLAFLFFIPI